MTPNLLFLVFHKLHRHRTKKFILLALLQTTSVQSMQVRDSDNEIYAKYFRSQWQRLVLSMRDNNS